MPGKTGWAATVFFCSGSDSHGNKSLLICLVSGLAAGAWLGGAWPGVCNALIVCCQSSSVAPPPCCCCCGAGWTTFWGLAETVVTGCVAVDGCRLVSRFWPTTKYWCFNTYIPHIQTHTHTFIFTFNRKRPTYSLKRTITSGWCRYDSYF